MTTKHHDHITILDGKIESHSYHIAQGMREKNEGIPEVKPTSAEECLEEQLDLMKLYGHLTIIDGLKAAYRDGYEAGKATVKEDGEAISDQALEKWINHLRKCP